MDKKLNVFILAAGRGLRMGKLGESCPKSLININNQTILSLIIKKLDKIKAKKKYFFVLGYKYKKILSELRKNKTKFDYTYNKKYSKTGSAYSWYLLKKYLKKNKRDTILIHADIYFHQSHLEKIVYSKKKNLIGSVQKNKVNVRKKGWVLTSNKGLQINRLRQKRNNSNFYGEISCINKFSTDSMTKIFKFMKNYFKKNGENFTWEVLLNEIINSKVLKVYTNSFNNNYWFNVNKPSDLAEVKLYLKSNKKIFFSA